MNWISKAFAWIKRTPMRIRYRKALRKIGYLVAVEMDKRPFRNKIKKTELGIKIDRIMYEAARERKPFWKREKK